MMCGGPVGPLNPGGAEFLVPEEFLTGGIAGGGVGFSYTALDEGVLLFSAGAETLLLSIGFGGLFKFPKK